MAMNITRAMTMLMFLYNCLFVCWFFYIFCSQIGEAQSEECYCSFSHVTGRKRKAKYVFILKWYVCFKSCVCVSIVHVFKHKCYLLYCNTNVWFFYYLFWGKNLCFSVAAKLVKPKVKTARIGSTSDVPAVPHMSHALKSSKDSKGGSTSPSMWLIYKN